MRERVVNDITMWIEECIRLNRKITIKMVARKSGYSLRHIHNIFKQEVATTIGNYIRLRRITYAALLVKFTKKSIFDIAIDLNYGSQQTFCRAFSETFKCNPLKYRKRSYIDTSELYPPYQGRITHLQFEEEETSIQLRAKEFKFEENIIGECEVSSNLLKLEKIMAVLNCHSFSYIASDYLKLNSYESVVGVKSFVGFREDRRSGADFYIKKRKYATICFQGYWCEYIIFKRNLYVNSSFKRVDGFDVEVFSLLPNNMNSDIKPDIKIFVPILGSCK